MEIKDNKPKRVVYDIETLRGCFTCSDLDIDTGEINQFVIHSSKNQLNEFLDYFKKVKLSIGFNNQNFDYPVIHFMIKMQDFWNDMLKKQFYDVNGIIIEIHNYAGKLIEEQNTPMGFFKTHAIKPEDEYVTQLDLFKLWHYNNKAKGTSLKALEVSMNLDNVMEMNIDHNKEIISLEELNHILIYNLNDVKATYQFYLKSKDKIKLRYKIKKKYDLYCYNWNDGKLGEELTLKLYCNRTKKDYWTIKKSRTHYIQIEVKNCIPKNVFFKEFIFKEVFNNFTKKVINIQSLEDKIKGIGDICSIAFKGCIIDYGIGGIHGVTKKGVYESDNNYIIETCDVNSLYPNLAIVLGLYPKHLGEIFLEVYKEDIVDVRMAEKAKDKKDQDLAIVDGFKAAANIVYGKSGDKNSYLFDYNYTFSTTIAGQLYLSMLIEQLAEIPNMKLLMVNTDGLEVLIEKKYRDKYKEICKNWEEQTKLTLEFDSYQKMWIGDVNNYGCISTSGKIKNKGRFEVDKVVGNEPAYHKDNSFRIVPLALQQYFAKGIPVETTIRNHLTNIYEKIENYGILDFCGRQKFNRDSYGETIDIVPQLGEDENAELIGTKQQKVVRYYVANNGSRFIKRYNKGTSQFIHKGYSVKIMNQQETKNTLQDYNIDVSFYIKEAYKEIHAIEAKGQLGLFN